MTASSMIGTAAVLYQGPERAKMVINIDLDSWEVGYADGQFGHLSQCPANLDSFSYSSGYWEGRACHAATGTNQSARRRASSFHR